MFGFYRFGPEFVSESSKVAWRMLEGMSRMGLLKCVVDFIVVDIRFQQRCQHKVIGYI